MHQERAGRWLLHSGIQQPGGGVGRYRLNDRNLNKPVSTEITGYAASAFVWLHRTAGGRAYLDAAIRAADFLVNTAWNPDLETFPFECEPGSPGYFFDCGIIVRGLLAVSRETGRENYRDIALACGRSMARDFLTESAIHPVISLPGREPWPYEKRWSREPGCFLLKSALAWRDLGLNEYWERALQMALENYLSFLPGTLDEEKIMDRLHAYSYFMEALLAEPSRPECVEALRVSIPRAAGYLRAIAPRFARSDVYAQVLRVRWFADRLGIVPLDRAAAEEEANEIRTFQYADAAPAIHGAYCFGRKSGELLPFANPVSTAFCVQALDLWSGRFDAKLEDLI